MSADSLLQLRQDRALRDAAMALVKADYHNVQASLSEASVTERATLRAKSAARDIAHEAADLARDNKGVVAAVAGATALWFAREPLLDFVLGRADDTDDYGDEYDDDGIGER